MKCLAEKKPLMMVLRLVYICLLNFQGEYIVTLHRHKSFYHSVFSRLSTRPDLPKMSADLKFDYMNALKSVNYSQSQVDVLRESVKNVAIIPKSLTNKQVNFYVTNKNRATNNKI